ncbi:unnamed protein product, partial [Brassica oleracea var. botrytis]
YGHRTNEPQPLTKHFKLRGSQTSSKRNLQGPLSP